MQGEDAGEFRNGKQSSQSSRTMLDETQPQPLLPRLSMSWFFILVAVVAVSLFIIRAAEQGRVLQAALVFTGLFVFLGAVFSATSFLIAYALGSVERAVVGKSEEPASPFSDGSLPTQVIPPRPVDPNS